MFSKVRCGPGDHDIFLEQAYWCGNCGTYVCHRHALTSILIDTIQCPRRHDLIPGGPVIVEPVRVRPWIRL
jgi:hypothetical protein